MITPQVRRELLDRAQTKENYVIHALGYSLRRFAVDEFLSAAVESWKPGSRVLDLGGHKSSKRGLFNIDTYNLKIIYVNISTQKPPDVQADAAHTPFRDNSFDYVICSELLEHVPNPQEILKEVYRILKPEGVLIATVPFMFHIHADPHDYGRYTDTYWQTQLEGFQFTNISIVKQGLYWSVLLELIRLWLYDRAKHQSPKPLILRQFIVWLLAHFQRWAVKREGLPSYQRDKFYGSFVLGYGIQCRK